MGARRRRAHRSLAGLDVGRAADEEYGGGDAAYARAPSARLAEARARESSGRDSARRRRVLESFDAWSSHELAIAACACAVVFVVVFSRLV